MAAAAGSRQMFPERQPSSRADVLQLHRWLRAELTRILTHWVSARGVDGFVLDAPPQYLAVPEQREHELHRLGLRP